MELFLKVFGSKNATLHEEALMAVGAVANGKPYPPPSLNALDHFHNCLALAHFDPVEFEHASHF
jgi:hypothetical protein